MRSQYTPTNGLTKASKFATACMIAVMGLSVTACGNLEESQLQPQGTVQQTKLENTYLNAPKQQPQGKLSLQQKRKSPQGMERPTEIKVERRVQVIYRNDVSTFASGSSKLSDKERYDMSLPQVSPEQAKPNRVVRIIQRSHTMQANAKGNTTTGKGGAIELLSVQPRKLIQKEVASND